MAILLLAVLRMECELSEGEVDDTRATGQGRGRRLRESARGEESDYNEEDVATLAVGSTLWVRLVIGDA